MVQSRFIFIACLVALAACKDEVTHADTPSPQGDYHVVVQECPQRGSFFWSGDTSLQVSVLPAGVSEACNAFMNSLHQFESYAPPEDLELEWTTPTELRAWHPGFSRNSWPNVLRSQATAPVEIRFAPADGPAS